MEERETAKYDPLVEKRQRNPKERRKGFSDRREKIKMFRNP